MVAFLCYTTIVQLSVVSCFEEGTTVRAEKNCFLLATVYMLHVQEESIHVTVTYECISVAG